MATKRVTVTLDEEQLARVWALVVARSASTVSGFVPHRLPWPWTMSPVGAPSWPKGSAKTGGPLSDDEPAWADDILERPRRPTPAASCLASRSTRAR